MREWFLFSSAVLADQNHDERATASKQSNKKKFCLSEKFNPKHEMQGSKKLIQRKQVARSKKKSIIILGNTMHWGRKRKMMNEWEYVFDFISIELPICMRWLFFPFSPWHFVKLLKFRSVVIFFQSFFFRLCVILHVFLQMMNALDNSYKANCSACAQSRIQLSTCGRNWRCILVPINLNPIFCYTFSSLYIRAFCFDICCLFNGNVNPCLVSF